MPPLADPTTVTFVKNFCQAHLVKYGLSALYLIGSRANGNPRPNSDHDFLAVVSDSAPPEITTGDTLHTKIFNQLNSERTRAGLQGIDLVIQRSSHHATSSQSPGTFANAAATKGMSLL